jgi:hypothetical protein
MNSGIAGAIASQDSAWIRTESAAVSIAALFPAADD